MAADTTLDAAFAETGVEVLVSLDSDRALDLRPTGSERVIEDEVRAHPGVPFVFRAGAGDGLLCRCSRTAVFSAGHRYGGRRSEAIT